MSSDLTKDQVEDLLINVLGSPRITMWKGSKIQFCCTVHGESHPSAGIDIDFVPEGSDMHYQVFHCFSCGAKGSIPWLVYKSLPETYHSLQQAADFLKDRYNLDEFSFNFDAKALNLPRYEEHFSELSSFLGSRHVEPFYHLALYMSGKETYQYFFDRGFSKQDLQDYMIGRDTESETVTIPAFWEDHQLAGVIGRYIDPNRRKNERYKIYNFQKADLVFPLDKLQVVEDTIIGVEGMFDAMMLHKWGYPNAVAMMGGGMSTNQANIVANRCKKFIALFDHDDGGAIACSLARKELGDRVLFLTPTYYPLKGKDPGEWGELETNAVIRSAGITSHKLPRL